MCVFRGRPLYSYQCVCVHALFPSVHGFRLCISIRFECPSVSPSVLCLCFGLCLCVVHCGVSAGDVVPVFTGSFDVSVLCLCIVAVVYWSCAVPVFFQVLSVLNSRGRVCQRFYCTDLLDDLESISTLWRRDHLSAIRLLGNLFQTTFAHDDFPSNPTSPPPLLSRQIPKPPLMISILIPNALEHYWLDLLMNLNKAVFS